MEKTDFLREIPEIMKKHGIKNPLTGNERSTVCAQKRGEDENKSLLQIIITLNNADITVRFEGIDKQGFIKKDEDDLGIDFENCSIGQVEMLIRLFALAWRI